MRFADKIEVRSKRIADIAIQIGKENGCDLKTQEWRSKYNEHVVYDYEPFCSDGFNITLEFECESKSHFEFLKFLLDRKVEEIDNLNKLLQG